ncbi:MAG: uroporphyrinogen-III synthase, partial [Dehalococcoidales bacterium]|nr:uroporphyrinogen-III synthase [Dehalococcoidales bacterium]
HLGADVEEVAAYHTAPATESIEKARQAIVSGEIDVITFTSSSTVSNLVAAFGGEIMPIKNIKVACIGPKTAETAVNAGLNVDILAAEQTIPGLFSALEEYFEEGLDGKFSSATS